MKKQCRYIIINEDMSYYELQRWYSNVYNELCTLLIFVFLIYLTIGDTCTGGTKEQLEITRSWKVQHEIGKNDVEKFGLKLESLG